MGQITWRNVDAPDFSVVGYNIRTASDLLGNATDKLSSSIGAFKDSATQDAGNAIMARALQYQDPSTYRQALSEGTLFNGIDPSAVSMDTLKTLNTRAGDLLNQASAQQNLSDTQYKSDRGRMVDSKLDAAAPALVALSRAYQSGDANQIAQVQKQYGDVLSGLPAEQAMSAMQSLQGFESTGLTNTNRRFDNYTTQRNDADQQNAMQALSTIRRGAVNPQDALTLAEPIMNQLTPGARSLVMSGLDKLFPGTYSGGGVLPSTGGQAGTRTGSPYDATFQFTSTGGNNITNMPLGDVINFQKDVLHPQTGGTPVGAYQFTKDTLADYGPKVLGKDWMNQPLTPENQEKLGKKIFEDRKGGDLTKTWASLPNNQPGAYANMSWDEVKPIIAQGEVGAKPHQLTSADKAAGYLDQALIGTRLMQNNAVGITPDYLEGLSDTSDIGQISQKLSDTSFKGADPTWIAGHIKKVMDETGVSERIAGDVVRRSMAQDTSGTFGFGQTGSGGWNIDTTKRNEIISGLKRNEPVEQAVRNIGLVEAASLIPQAQESYQQAAAELMDLQRRIQSGQTNLQPLVAGRIAKLEKAKRLLDMASEQVQNNPDNLAPRNFNENKEKRKKETDTSRKSGTQAAYMLRALMP